MLETRSETFTTGTGASVEVATVTHEGHAFTNLGAVVDHQNGFACAYPDGKGHVAAWSGAVLGTARIVGQWKQFVPGAYGRVDVYAWRCTIDGRSYYGRNGGPNMLVRLRAAK